MNVGMIAGLVGLGLAAVRRGGNKASGGRKASPARKTNVAKKAKKTKAVKAKTNAKRTKAVSSKRKTSGGRKAVSTKRKASGGGREAPVRSGTKKAGARKQVVSTMKSRSPNDNKGRANDARKLAQTARTPSERSQAMQLVKKEDMLAKMKMEMQRAETIDEKKDIAENALEEASESQQPMWEEIIEKLNEQEESMESPEEEESYEDEYEEEEESYEDEEEYEDDEEDY